MRDSFRLYLNFHDFLQKNYFLHLLNFWLIYFLCRLLKNELRIVAVIENYNLYNRLKNCCLVVWFVVIAELPLIFPVMILYVLLISLLYHVVLALISSLIQEGPIPQILLPYQPTQTCVTLV